MNCSPWFMDLTFQVPMQFCSSHALYIIRLYFHYQSHPQLGVVFALAPSLHSFFLTHSSILAWRFPGMGEPGGLLSMGSHRVRHDWSDLAAAASLFLELFLHLSPVAYWEPTDLGSSSFSVLSFCLFILFMGISKQECWRGLPFPSPVDHVLSEFSTMTHPFWVALHSMAHSFRSDSGLPGDPVNANGQREMPRVNIDILGVSELKCAGMGEFNLDNHYIYYCWQESFGRNGVAFIVNKRVWNAVVNKRVHFGCNLKNDRKISVHFQGKPFNITVIQVYAPTSNAKEADIERFFEDLQDHLKLTLKKDVLFIIGDWNAKVRS